MCGISVIVALDSGMLGKAANGIKSDIREKIANDLKASLEMIAHRGPDSQGIWISEDNRVGNPTFKKFLPM